MVSPGVSYQQLWIAQKMHRTWNSTTKKIDTTVTKGFFFDQQTSFSLGLSTALFGTFHFKHSKISALRHVIRPSLSISYKPDLSRNHFYTFEDTNHRRFRFSEFEGSLYGYFPEGQYGGISLTVDNNLEMKVKSKTDTTNGGMKKVKLIDGYGFSTNYNMMADSFQLSPINLYLRSTLFEKINITATATVNPYDYDRQGFPVDKLFTHNGKFTPGRLSNGSLSVSSSFQSKPKDAKKDAERKKQMDDLMNDPAVGGQRELLEEMRRNPADFVDFNIAWQAGFGYTLFFSEQLKTDLSGFEKKFSSNISFNGGFNLTPKWNLSVNGYYDLDTKKLQTFQMNISREMHCWQMAISITPVGLYRFFSINISPKASILQDLKINRTRSFVNFQ
jgi:LPS-assembly protein